MGLIEIIQEGRFPGSPESLGTCPMPQLKDPAGRTYLRGDYQGGMGLVSQFLLPGEAAKCISQWRGCSTACSPNHPRTSKTHRGMRRR